MKSVRTPVFKLIPIVVFFAFLLISVNLHAQDNQTGTDIPPTLKYGLKAGGNLTNMFVNTGANTEKMKVGFNAGIFAKLPLGHGFSFQPELIYTLKGAKETYNDQFSSPFGSTQGTSAEYGFTMGYVELPLLGVMNITKNFSVHAGPYISYLTNSYVRKLSTTADEVEGVDDIKAKDLSRYDWGVLAGLELDVKKWTIGARYNYGLNKVGKPDREPYYVLRNSKQAGVSVYLAYTL